MKPQTFVDWKKQFYTKTESDARFLKLDASNDPITGALNITPSTDTIPLTLKGGGAGSADLIEAYNYNNVLRTELASSGAQSWFFGSTGAEAKLVFTTPAGYPGVIGYYPASSALWTLSGNSGQANWSRSGEYGFKHYTTGYMELGNASNTSLAYSQLFVNNSTGTTKTVLTLRMQVSQTGDIQQMLDSTNSLLFGIRSDGNIKIATSQAVSGGSPALLKRLPIYNASNTLIGYIPIYDANL